MSWRFNVFAGLASVASLAVGATQMLVPGQYAGLVQAVLSGVCVISLVVFYVLGKRFEHPRSTSKRKEELVKEARKLIDSATSQLVLFSNDLSWVHDYSDRLREAIGREVTVAVVHRRSTTTKVQENVRHLKALGALVFELDFDHRLRATLVDPHEVDRALLFVAHKRRRNGDSSPVLEGEPGGDKEFLYECGRYQDGADRVIIRALSRLSWQWTQGKVGAM